MGKAIGIDFGTTNTVVSYLSKNGHLRQYKQNGQPIIPTAIYFLSGGPNGGQYVIGSQAKSRIDAMRQPKAGITDFKSHLGEPTFVYEVEAENKDVFKVKPKEAMKLFLHAVITEVENTLRKTFGGEGRIDRAVITVPAKFNDVEKSLIRRAAVAAMNLHISKVKLVMEPTAAAVAAQEDEGDGKGNDDTVLIYDFGGGTFDVSLIKKEHGKFRQVAANGEPKLGGNNLTEIMMETLLAQINDEYGTEFPMDPGEFDEDLHEISQLDYQKNMLALRRAANQAKEELSEELETDVSINVILPNEKNETFYRTVSRDDYEKLIREKIKHTADITWRTIHEPQAEAIAPIDRIVMAGGSSRIPMIKALLEEKLGRGDIVYSEDVSTLISRGACLLANSIQDIDNLTQQVTSVQLGVIASEGTSFNQFRMIVPENEPLPCDRSEDFHLNSDEQRRLDIAYYERDVKNYPKAKRIDDNGIQEVDILHIDIPEGRNKDNTIVTVTFGVKANGCVAFTAQLKDEQGNVLQEVSVQQESDLE